MSVQCAPFSLKHLVCSSGENNLLFSRMDASSISSFVKKQEQCSINKPQTDVVLTAVPWRQTGTGKRCKALFTTCHVYVCLRSRCNLFCGDKFVVQKVDTNDFLATNCRWYWPLFALCSAVMYTAADSAEMTVNKIEWKVWLYKT